MEPKLQDLQAKYDILDDLGQMEKDDVVWEGEDEALQEKEEVEQRHRDLLEKLQLKKDILSNELSKYMHIQRGRGRGADVEQRGVGLMWSIKGVADVEHSVVGLM